MLEKYLKNDYCLFFLCEIGPFPSCFEPNCESKAKCQAFHAKNENYTRTAISCLGNLSQFSSVQCIFLPVFEYVIAMNS